MRRWDSLTFPERKATYHIVVHCSASPEGRDDSAEDIDRWHVERGWRAIGYHYVIRLDGAIETGRPEDTVGSHASVYNATSVGICLIGGVDADDKDKAKDTFTEQQLTSLELLLDRLMKKYPRAILSGHRDLDDRKSCPAFNVRKWWKEATLAKQGVYNVNR